MTSFLLVFWTKLCMHFSSFPCLLYVLSNSSPWLNHSNNFWQLWSFSLCNFLQSPITSSFSGLNILLSSLFYNTLKLCKFLNVIDQVPYTYIITVKITMLHILIFLFLDRRWEDKGFRTKYKKVNLFRRPFSCNPIVTSVQRENCQHQLYNFIKILCGIVIYAPFGNKFCEDWEVTNLISVDLYTTKLEICNLSRRTTT
jgi:hypothetical protein